jgi:hypothetical protein
MVCREVVGQNGKVEEWIALQFLCEVKPVFTQPPGTWREGCDQTDLHSSPTLQCSGFDVLSREDVGSLWQERNRFRRSEFSLHLDRRGIAMKSRPSQNPFAGTPWRSIP